MRVGDQVLAADPDEGTLAAQTVTAVMAPEHAATEVTISVRDGGSFTATDYHLIWLVSTRSWTPAGELSVGEQLRAPSGQSVTISRIREQQDWVPTGTSLSPTITPSTFSPATNPSSSTTVAKATARRIRHIPSRTLPARPTLVARRVPVVRPRMCGQEGLWSPHE